MVDRPVMQYIVEEAVSAGIEDILIITNRGKDVMEDYFDYAPELEDKLRRAGKDDLIELVHKPANLANIFFCAPEADSWPGPRHLSSPQIRGQRTFRRTAGR